MEQFKNSMTPDNIAAIATPPGTGGIAVIRVSGPDAIEIVQSAWKGKRLSEVKSHTVTLGKYVATDGSILDEALASVFLGPNSFTGENVVEISAHGSTWIQREILSDLIRRGARTAGPGEFTQRAFLNGRIDLAQAEGVADLIAASSRAAHHLAMSQTRGGFSKELDSLRDKLIEFSSLLELELDFSEEDVEFAERQRLHNLATAVLNKIERLAKSYSSGSAIKEGFPVVIAGVPNAGKSSLLNLLTGDDKAIVTDIPGTTRDIIEDTVEIDGILFRFFDTAGLRESADKVESIGIGKARSKMREARIVIWIIDPCSPLSNQIAELRTFQTQNSGITIIPLLNKSDICLEHLTLQPLTAIKSGDETDKTISQIQSGATVNSGMPDADIKNVCNDAIRFSTKTKEGLDILKRRLSGIATEGFNPQEELIVTNARHYESLIHGAESLRRAISGIESGISADFIAQDIRESLHHLGTITGAITTSDLLQSIFTRFCIGK